MGYKTLDISWNNIAITIAYDPDYFPSCSTGHIEVRCERPLPITETGYKSLFINRSDIADVRIAAAFIIQALDQSAAQKNWQAETQLSLF